MDVSNRNKKPEIHQVSEKEIVMSALTIWEVLGAVVVFVSIPFAWLWARLTSQHEDNVALAKKLEDHRVHVAETTSSTDEVRIIVADIIKPVEVSVNRIEKSVDKLIERRSVSRD